MNVAMCVTDSETKQKSSNCQNPRTGKILPSSWFGGVLAYSIQFQWEALSILYKELTVIFHLKHTHCTDLMSSVKLRRYHQLLVKVFHEVWGCDHSVDLVLCVCAQRVTLLDNRQTRPLPSLVTSSIWPCFHHLCKCMHCQQTCAWFLTRFFGAYVMQCCWDVFLHILMQSLPSSSVHILLPQILFSMHFVLFSFNRWHKVGIWDAEKHQAWPCQRGAQKGEEGELGRRWKWGCGGFNCTFILASGHGHTMNSWVSSSLANGKWRSNPDGFSLGYPSEVYISAQMRHWSPSCHQKSQICP